MHAPDPITNPISPTPVDVSVIIVNYNVREFLEQALQSVRRAVRDLQVEVFVVDNNSVDGSVLMVRDGFPNVHLIANESNVGFGTANNQAFEHATGRFLLILNPDTIVQEDTLESLVAFMDAHPDAGAAGCQILNPDGSFAPESRRSFPTPGVAFFRMTGLGRLFPRSPLFGRYNMTFLPRDEVAQVDALSGSCMLIRRTAIHGDPVHRRPGAGALFDEDFFMYGEDLDLCYRIQQAGWKIYYTPATQIIHYKGESTKKGEIRYVRLFYGAMVLFTRKHLRSRYSRIFASLLHAAIVIRAALTLLAGGIRRLAAPLADFAVVYGVVTLLGYVRSARAGAELSPLFFITVAPAFALGTIIGVLLTGGYRQAQLTRIRPLLLGTALGFLLVASASFFAQQIAFSRAVVALSLPTSALLLVIGRLIWQARHAEPRRAIVVGERDEAERLYRLLAAHPQAPFVLDGFVQPGDAGEAAGSSPADLDGVRRLGARRHLRDLVRLHRIDDVVFAVKDLSNQRIFEVMQGLRDLPVQFRMLGEDGSHVIGKASVADLALPELSDGVSGAMRMRSPLGRNAFGLLIASFGLLCWPLVWLLARIQPSFAPAANRLARLGPVLTGRTALVGVEPSHKGLIPVDWQMKAGVFNITDLLQGRQPTDSELTKAYWFYVTHQSARLDWEIIFRTLAAR